MRFIHIFEHKSAVSSGTFVPVTYVLTFDGRKVLFLVHILLVGQHYIYVLCSNEVSPELKGSAFSSLSLLYDGLSSTNALIGLQNGAEKKILVRVENRYGEYILVHTI